MDMKPQPESSTPEVLAGLVERVTYHNVENGFCVLRAKARGHRDVVTVVGHAATISAGEWITASGEWVNDRTHGQQFKARFLRTSPPTSADGTPGQVRDAWLIDRRSSAEAPHLLLRAALEYCAAGGAKVATVMRHAGADTLNVRDILVAEPHRVWFASRALLRGPLLRSCGQRRACERETEKRKGRDWSQIQCGANSHSGPPLVRSAPVLLSIRRAWQ